MIQAADSQAQANSCTGPAYDLARRFTGNWREFAVTGEGGSGGALAIAVGDVVLMLENSVYSVISPEGCASILWRDRSRNVQAADALRLAASDLLALGVVDEVVPEPLGGAHRDPEDMAARLGDRLRHHLEALRMLPPAELLQRRRARLRRLGVFETAPDGRPVVDPAQHRSL